MSSSGVHSCFFFPLWVGIILSLRCERRKNVFFFGVGGERGIDSEDESKFWT
jgi:hypothetical protein